VTANRGGPQRPLTSAELESKFSDNATRALDADAAAAVVRAVRALRDAPDVAELVASTVSGHAS
jgi:hypothetical protein